MSESAGVGHYYLDTFCKSISATTVRANERGQVLHYDISVLAVASLPLTPPAYSSTLRRVLFTCERNALPSSRRCRDP